jgi:hypothetical protein
VIARHQKGLVADIRVQPRLFLGRRCHTSAHRPALNARYWIPAALRRLPLIR